MSDVENHENNNNTIIKDSWDINDFELQQCLGTGKFGVVYTAKEIKSQKEVAIKLIAKSIVLRFAMLEQLKLEIEVHTRLYHPNIIRMYAYFYDTNNVYIVYEKATNGNLFELLKSGIKLTEKDVAKIIYQIASSLAFIRKKNLIHRDLKLENVLVNKKRNGEYEVKLCDFGCVTPYYHPLMKATGTTDYFAPEICLNHSYDFGVDTWALGIMAYELFCNCSPFSCKDEKYTIAKIKEYNEFKDISQPVLQLKPSRDFIDFFKKILEKDPHERISIDQVLEHSWFKNHIN